MKPTTAASGYSAVHDGSCDNRAKCSQSVATQLREIKDCANGNGHRSPLNAETVPEPQDLKPAFALRPRNGQKICPSPTE